MNTHRLKVAWISEFPVEWLDEVPAEIAGMPRLHPMTWQRVLLSEGESNPNLELHVVAIRKHAPRSLHFERRGVRFHVLKAPPFLRAPSLCWLDILLIRRCLRPVQPNLVHAWGSERGAPYVATRLPWRPMATMHGILAWLGEQIPLNAYFRVMARLERRALASDLRVTAESAPAVAYLQRRFPRVRPIQIEHAPHPLFRAVRRQPPADRVRLLFNGPFNTNKGADLLVRALRELETERELELQVIGTAEPRFFDEMRQVGGAGVWSRIAWQHGLSAAEVAQRVADATLLVFPTRADNSPNAVKEAVVAGLPVVSSAVGGVPAYVEHGKNGLLFPCGDFAAFKATLRQALQDPVLGRGAVDAATLARVRAELDPAVMARRFWDVYRQEAGFTTGT